MDTESSATIDRAKAYGDGLFETIAIRDGEARFWNLHLDRLQAGCTRLGLEHPSASDLTAKLENELARKDIDLTYATARLVVAAARSPRGYRRAMTGQPVVSLELFSAAPLPQVLYEEGVATTQCNLRLAEQPALAGIKSLNRLEQVLARAEWADPEIFEGLMLDTSDRLICGTMSNVFAVINSTVCTPSLERCGVAGIMRTRVMQLLRENGVDVETRDIDAQELSNASELFLTNSQFGVLPIRAFAQTPRSIGPATRQAQTLIAASGVPESSP